jgi:hypothetical protein
MTGVLRTNTPSPSVLPTQTVFVAAAGEAAVVAVGLVGGDGDGEGIDDAAARATVGATVGTTVGTDVAAGEAPKTPHALSTIAAVLAPSSVRQPVIFA